MPVTLAVNLAGVGLLTLASILGPVLGPAFGLLIQMGALVGGVYLLSFAPVIAVDEAAAPLRHDGTVRAGRAHARRGEPDVRGDLRRGVDRAAGGAREAGLRPRGEPDRGQRGCSSSSPTSDTW